MWKNRAAALKDEIAEVRERVSNTASIALLFDGEPVSGSREIRLDFATKALQDYQELVSVAFSDQAYAGGVSSKGRLKGRDSSRLFIQELVRGSFGFILEEATRSQAEAVTTPLKSSVDYINGIIQKITDNSGSLAFEDINPRIIKSLKKWATTLSEARSSLKIMDDNHQIIVSTQKIADIVKSLNDFEVTDDVRKISGMLEGFLPTKGTFEFRWDEGVLSGSVSDEFADELSPSQAEFLFKKGTASVRFVKTIRNNVVEREQRVLEGIVFDPDDQE
jgi:hypothetical protein